MSRAIPYSLIDLNTWSYHAMDQEQEGTANAALESVTLYYGEDFAEKEPARVLKIIHDFTLLYNKVLADIEVGLQLSTACICVLQ